uniref:Uncharacterized protein n=1 Tax=Setaria digitata TaxID=48799 RepID=A0A915Q3D0_9BILA
MDSKYKAQWFKSGGKIAEKELQKKFLRNGNDERRILGEYLVDGGGLSQKKIPLRGGSVLKGETDGGGGGIDGGDELSLSFFSNCGKHQRITLCHIKGVHRLLYV